MPQQMTTIGAKVSDDDKERLNDIAESRSTDDRTVTVSDLIREAINQHLTDGTTYPNKGIDTSIQNPTPSGDFRGSENGNLSDVSEESEEGLNSQSTPDGSETVSESGGSK